MKQVAMVLAGVVWCACAMGGVAPERGRYETCVEAGNLTGKFAKDLPWQMLVVKGRDLTRPLGMKFGESGKPGARSMTVEFTKPVKTGSVYLGGGGLKVEWRAGTGDVWRAMCRTERDGREAYGQVKGPEEASFWNVGGVVEAQAFRLTAEIADDALPDGRGKYAGRVAGMYVFPFWVENIAPLGTAFAGTNPREAKNLNNGKANCWEVWRNEPNGKEVSEENPFWAGIGWAKPAEFSGLGFNFARFDAVEVQVCTAGDDVHPRDAPEEAWKTVRKYKGFNNLYPMGERTTWVDLGEEVRTRGLRLKFTAPMAKAAHQHPHVRESTDGGKLVMLSELYVLANAEKAEALRNAVKPDAAPKGVAVEFDMPFDGLASLVIEKKDGTRVRNLIHAREFKAGRNVAWWDGSDDLGRDTDAAAHGHYNIPFRPVDPGEYVVRGVAVKPVKPRYGFSIYWAGQTPWPLPDHTGGWLANHTPPRAAAFMRGRDGKEDLVAIGANITEGPDGLAFVTLDGRKVGGRKWIGGTWTCAAFLAADGGERPVSKHVLYAGGIGEGADRKKELRLTALTEGGEERLAKFPLGEGDADTAVGGIAVRNGEIAIAFRHAGKVVTTNLVDGIAREFAVDSPRGVAFSGDGELSVLSGRKLVRFALVNPGKPEIVVAEGLEDPQGLACNAAGDCFVTDWGGSHQVKVFGRDGEFKRAIGKAGKPSAGKYDERHMNHPAGVCVDSRGRVWVAECDYAPKRVSVWGADDGKLERSFYGPPKYGAGGTFDTRDETRFYYDEEGALMEFEVDHKSGTWKLARVLTRKVDGAPAGRKYFSPPQRTVYIKTPKGERKYLTNAWNANPVAGADAAGLWEIRGDRLEHVTTVSAPQGRRWHGVSILDDGTLTVACMQDGEGTWASAKFRAVCVKPEFDADGNPRYDMAKAETVFARSMPSPSTGGNQLVRDAAGNWLITNGVEPLPGYSVSGGTAGRATWSIPNMWPGLHAGHSAPRVDTKERLTAPTRMLGPAIPVDGTGMEIVALNGNHGEIYLFTTEGIMFETVFRDARFGKAWGAPGDMRGRDMTEVSPSDEHFWPTIAKGCDGRIMLTAGKDSCSVIRLENLETLRRIGSRKVNISAQDIRRLMQEREEFENRRRKSEGSGRLALATDAKPVKVDGDLKEWDETLFASIENSGTAAYFDSHSKPYDIRGGLRTDGKKLYAAWRTEGVKNLAENSGESPELLFKTGGGCDLMLDVRGGVRLLGAVVKGKPLVMMYEKRVPGVKAKDRVPFTSPVMTVTMDRVRDVTGLVEFAGARDGSGYEMAIPLGLIGLETKEGMKLRGDIGVLRGQNGATVARSYWANKATAIVSDVPSEAELKPSLWGEIEAGK